MPTATANATDKLVDRMVTIRKEMKDELVDRGTEIDLITCSILAKVHMILIGGAGIAKSMLVDQMFAHVEGINLFKHMLSKNTVPQEVFGPPSMIGLDNDEFHFVTGGYMPEAHLVFLDEGFKSNSAVLNGQLTLVNERKFKAGIGHPLADPNGWMESPLWTSVIASNELPTHDREDLVAYRDRYGITKLVEPARGEDAIMKIIDGQLARYRGETVSDSFTTIAREDIEALQAAVAQVQVPQGVQRALADLNMKAENAGLPLSPRRMFEGLRVCMANALLNGRFEVKTEDLRLFEHVLWNDPDEIKTAADLTVEFAGLVGTLAAQRRTEFEEANAEFVDAQRKLPDDGVLSDPDLVNSFTTCSSRFAQIDRAVEENIQQAADNAWDSAELESLQAEIKRARQSCRKIMGMVIE